MFSKHQIQYKTIPQILTVSYHKSIRWNKNLTGTLQTIDGKCSCKENEQNQK